MNIKPERVSDEFILKAIAQLEKHLAHYRERPPLYDVPIVPIKAFERDLSIFKELQDYRAAIPKVREALENIAKKKPHAVNRAEAADMSIEFHMEATKAQQLLDAAIGTGGGEWAFGTGNKNMIGFLQ